MFDRVLAADCLEGLREFPDNSVQLIYLDPPFNTNMVRSTGRNAARRAAYADSFGSAEDYIAFMRPRINEMRRVLKPNGSIFFHCDWRMSHHVRSLLDDTFDVFVNEIIWHYGLGAAKARRHLLTKHDVIFWHARSRDYVFNLQRCEPTPAMLQKYRHVDERGRRYMMSYGRRYSLQGGKPLDDVWDIPAIAPTSRERAGYPTQKPLALLERVVGLASNAGDVVLDPFCGSGTTLVAARQLGRRWVGIDVSADAVAVASTRLA